jgi:predicted dehydrogenase
MKDKVRIGIIGAGWVARERHLPALRALPEVRLEAIWSRKGENARQLASELNIARVAEHWQEIIESQTIDAVIVAMPPILHHVVSLSALHAGKHVLCQARLARNLREAGEMVSAAKRSGLVTALYPARPGLKGDLVVQRLLHRENYVGDVTEVRVTGLTKAEESDSYSWISDPQVVGVNAMALGMWVEVLNRWLGPAKNVTAIGKNHIKQLRNKDGEWEAPTVPDSLAVAAALDCGATASYHFSTSAQFAPNQSIAIYGTRGAIQYDFFPDVLKGASSEDKELRTMDISPDEERTQDTDHQFVRAILEGTPVSPDFEEGLRYVEFCEAVALSIQTQTTVSLPLAQPAMEHWGKGLGSSAEKSAFT